VKKKSKRVSRVKKGSTKNWGHRGPSSPMPVTVTVPSGRCPFVMEDASEETVTDWVVQLTNWKSPVITYAQSVYIYWIRHSFEMSSVEYRDAKHVIETVVPDRAKSIKDLIVDSSYLDMSE
jgi:hypothetical protein